MFGLFHAHQLYLPSQTQRPIFTCQGQTWSDLLSFIFRKTLCGSPAWKMSLFVSIASFAKISMDLALDLSKSVLFWTTCWNNLYKILPVVHSTLVPVEKKTSILPKIKVNRNYLTKLNVSTYRKRLIHATWFGMFLQSKEHGFTHFLLKTQKPIKRVMLIWP